MAKWAVFMGYGWMSNSGPTNSYYVWPVRAGVINVVNSNGDEEDADPNDGRCDIDLNTSGDQCTLRAAIQETNRRPGEQTIFFNIPGSGTPVILPVRPLPDIIEEVMFDASLQPVGKVIIDGTNAGANSNGLTIINGDVSLNGLTIRNFLGNGINATGSGYVLLENVDLEKNGAYGVIAEQDVFLNVKPVYSLQNTHRMLNTIAMNGTDLNGGGIRSKSGAIVGAWIDVNNNSGPGIIASGDITLGGVRSNNNSGPGIQSLRGFVSMLHDGGFGTPQVNDNEGHGIVSGSSNALTAGGGAGISIGTSIEVRNNAGWGILSSLTDDLSKSNEAVGVLINTDNATLLTNDTSFTIGNGNTTETLFIANGTSYITGNGNTAKRLFMVGPDGSMALSSGGGNMAVRGGIGSLNYIAADRIEVSGNNGPGIVATHNIKLGGVRSNSNSGPGIQSLLGGVWMLYDGGFGTSQVNENEGHGIVSGSSNTLEACGGRGVGIGTSIEVKNNAGWGILSSLTEALSSSNQAVGIMINTDNAFLLTTATSYITGNGNTAKRLFTVWQDGTVTLPGGGYEKPVRGGIGSLNYIAADRVEVSNNNGPGIVARKNIKLVGVKANSNSGIGMQSMQNNIAILFDGGFASQGCYNKGGNISARGISGAEYITFCDSDSDGISDDIEAAAPNNGDGNVDGIPDNQQMNVASFMASEKYLTVASASGTEIVGAAAMGGGVPVSVVQGISFPAGFIQYRVNMTPQRTTQAIPQQAATTTVTHILPEGTIMNTYWLYGPTRDNLADHWYAFMYDGATGAEIQGNKVVLHFTDGLRGDGDMLVNGEIALSPGGPVNVENVLRDLADAILVLQVLAQTDTSLYPSLPVSDVNGNGKIGMEEVLYILQVLAGIRE